MNIRILGAILVILGCGSFGFLIAASHRREVRVLRQLLAALDFMQCELQYRLTPLPDLCRQAATAHHGIIRNVFHLLAAELEDQISPDVERCMHAVLLKLKDIPKQTREVMVLLGRSLGRFDLEGQLNGLEAARQECRGFLEALTRDQSVRLRSYQTLGLCAGAALVILFI